MVWRPMTLVRLIEKSWVRLMFRKPGKLRLGGALATRLPHWKVGGSRIRPSWKYGVPDACERA